MNSHVTDGHVGCFFFFLGMRMSALEETQSHVNSLSYIPPYTPLHSQVSSVPGCGCDGRLHGLSIYIFRLESHSL